MKLKSLSELGDIYASIASTPQNAIASMVTEQASNTILATDVNQYLKEEKQVKPGSPLGGGPGTKGEISPLQKKTGPEGLKGNDFKKIDKIQDPASDPKEMKDVEEDKESKEDKENAHEAETAKNTTPQEKVRESAQESNKYNYKPHFTMSKPKFDQLYEEAIKGIPFTEDADMQEDNAMGADTGVASADDAAADAPDMGADEESQDVTITLPKELAQKLHDILMSSLGVSVSDGDEAGSEDGADEAPMGDSVKVEAVSQPEPREEKGNNAALQGKNNKVGDLHKAGGTAEKGSLKSQPEPKEEKGNNAALQGKNNKTGNLVTGKRMFD
jgi:hypothetical protein